MLSIEERHVIVQHLYEVIAARRAAERLHVLAQERRLDAAISAAARCELAEREFHEYINTITRWSEHPAVHEVAP